MSTPPPSTPAPGNTEPSTPAPGSPQPENSLRDSPADSATLSPLSPDSAAKLEPLSARTNDEAALLANPLPGASANIETGKRKGAASKPKPFRWAVWVISFLGFGLISVVLGLLYMTAGTITGTEFDAVNWTSRDFRFVRDLFTETQLTNVKHRNTGNFTVDPAIAAHITGGLARPMHPRWDLVRIFRGVSPSQGEAHILLTYLQAADSQGSNYWVQWTTDHPKAAPILWSAVRDAVHLERYDRLPQIFDLVRVDDDPQALKGALRKVMIALALDDARAHAKAGDRAAARQAATVGLSYGESDELRALAGDADHAK